jgi:Sigma-70, region 4
MPDVNELYASYIETRSSTTLEALHAALLALATSVGRGFGFYPELAHRTDQKIPCAEAVEIANAILLAEMGIEGTPFVGRNGATFETFATDRMQYYFRKLKKTGRAPIIKGSRSVSWKRIARLDEIAGDDEDGHSRREELFDKGGWEKPGDVAGQVKWQSIGQRTSGGYAVSGFEDHREAFANLDFDVLTFAERDVINLYLEGFTDAEIGNELSLSESQVYRRRHSAIEKLKSCLGENK